MDTNTELLLDHNPFISLKVARGEISNAITHGTLVFNVLLSHFSSRVTQTCISFSLENVKELTDQNQELTQTHRCWI